VVADRRERRLAGEDEVSAANRQTSSLAALAVALFLIVAGLFLVQALRACDEYQECVLAGRACAAPAPP
jgi:hypothetical protein